MSVSFCAIQPSESVMLRQSEGARGCVAFSRSSVGQLPKSVWKCGEEWCTGVHEILFRQDSHHRHQSLRVSAGTRFGSHFQAGAKEQGADPRPRNAQWKELSTNFGEIPKRMEVLFEYAD